MEILLKCTKCGRQVDREHIKIGPNNIMICADCAKKQAARARSLKQMGMEF